MLISEMTMTMHDVTEVLIETHVIKDIDGNDFTYPTYTFMIGDVASLRVAAFPRQEVQVERS